MNEERNVRAPATAGLRQRSWVAIWDLMLGDTVGVRALIDLARETEAIAVSDIAVRRFAGYNRALVEALLAVETGSPDARQAVTAADSVFGVGGVSMRHQAAYVLVLAELYRRIGETEAALDRYRREWILLGEESTHLLPARRLGRARMAAQLGLTGEAILSYEQYLALRSDPEPVLEEKVAGVRAELEALRAE
jgi:hypothetical protein